MRVVKIFSLLFSLGQFLLILKLIELVRGNPTPLSSYKVLYETSTQQAKSPQLQRQGRSFFLAPSKAKQKQYRPWGLTTTTTDLPTTDMNNMERFGIENDEEYQFEPFSGLNSTNNASSLHHTVISHGDDSIEGRLCPGCEGGACGQNLSSYGFPVIPVTLAILVGIIWFFVFLFLWYYASEPPKAGYAASGGYGYGYGASSGQDNGLGSGRTFSDVARSSIFNLFNEGQRSFSNLNLLTSLVTGSLSNLATLYNSA